MQGNTLNYKSAYCSAFSFKGNRKAFPKGRQEFLCYRYGIFTSIATSHLVLLAMTGNEQSS